MIGANLKDGDYIASLIHTTAHAYLMFFTSMGRVFRIKAHEVPRTSRTARGMAIVNLLHLAPDETVSAVIDTRDYETKRYLLFATRHGVVKRTRFLEYDKTRSRGLIAINLREGDELVRVLPTSGNRRHLSGERIGPAHAVSPSPRFGPWVALRLVCGG